MGCQTLTLSGHNTNARTSTCWQNYPAPPQQIKAFFQTNILVFPCSLRSTNAALRTPHWVCNGAAYSRIGSSTEVRGLPSAMRPLPIINGKEERRQKGEGRLVAALATALLSATARFWLAANVAVCTAAHYGAALPSELYKGLHLGYCGRADGRRLAHPAPSPFTVWISTFAWLYYLDLLCL